MPKKKRKPPLSPEQYAYLRLIKSDWTRRMEIMTLKNQGWSFQMIGDKLGITRQAVHHVYKKTKDLTIEELEKLANKYDVR